MILQVEPTPQLRGRVRLPASKSYSIRAAIVAACGGTSVLRGMSSCDDAKIALQVAGQLGAKVTRKKDRVLVDADHTKAPAKTYFVRESGTVLRFLLPLVCLKGKPATIVGAGTLRARPNRFLMETLRTMGADIRGQGEKETVPVSFRGSVVHPGKVSIDGSLSSQFISALLIACPKLDDDSTINITGRHVVSRDYIDMTRIILRDAGILIESVGQRRFKSSGRQNYRGLKNYIIPSDYGLAAFLMAAAALTESRVTLAGHFDAKYIQADGQIVPIFRKMGGRVQTGRKGLSLAGPFSLKGKTISMKNCPDLVPIVSVLALFAKGTTRLTNIEHVRTKESDRISDLALELRKVGAVIREKRGEMTIVPQSEYKTGCLLDPHHDHRLAMSFAVLGLRLGVRVKNIECSSKSYPEFVRDFKTLGARVRLSRR